MTTNEGATRVSGQTSTNRVMIENATFGIQTTSAQARVDALLVLTSFIAWTIGISNTFRSARRWTARITRKTRANRLIVYFAALTVRATRRWSTAVVFFHRRLLDDRSALNERISFGASWTCAHRKMIVNVTNGVWCASCALTRIDTLVSNTGLVSWTIAVQNTLRSALRVWITVQARETSTHSIMAFSSICTR